MAEAWRSLPLGAAGALLEDPEVSGLFALEAELETMLAVERALAQAQHAVGEIGDDALRAVEAACEDARFDLTALASGLRRDGVIVPEFVRQIRSVIGAPHASAFHRGATSQDVIDSALMIRLKRAVAILERRLAALVGQLREFSERHGGAPVMARTRFQDALPFTLSDRVETWVDPIHGLVRSAPDFFPIQLGGPIGLRPAAFGPHHEAVAEAMARDLGLSWAGRAWHTDRRAVAQIAHWCAGVSTALGKFGQDVALMAQNAVSELKVEGGGSSSMPHKNNPVRAELLVALARYTAGNSMILQGGGPHENERSGASWTLEWLVLPQVLIGCGTATITASNLLAGMVPAGTDEGPG